jgi:hypothetical protein
MSASLPCHKGTGLIPLVAALKSNPEYASVVPQSVSRYLREALMASEWYPEADYHVLLQTLAKLVRRPSVPDVWQYFGKTAAQRDLAGEQTLVPVERRIDGAGLYRRFIGNEVTSAASLFQRVGHIWSMYHNTGRLTFHRHAQQEFVVLVRLRDFIFPARGVAEMQSAYFCEYARLVGIEVFGRLVRSSSDGDPLTEWSYTLKPTPDIAASLALLPSDGG